MSGKRSLSDLAAMAKRAQGTRADPPDPTWDDTGDAPRNVLSAPPPDTPGDVSSVDTGDGQQLTLETPLVIAHVTPPEPAPVSVHVPAPEIMHVTPLEPAPVPTPVPIPRDAPGAHTSDDTRDGRGEDAGNRAADLRLRDAPPDVPPNIPGATPSVPSSVVPSDASRDTPGDSTSAGTGDITGDITLVLPRVVPRTANAWARQAAQVEPWGPKPGGPTPRAVRARERRAKVAQLNIELTPAQKAAILAAAAAEGVSVKEFVLTRLLEPDEVEY